MSVTSDQIYTQAEALLREGRFSMSALAEALGCSRPLLYRQVGKAEALLEALAREGVDVDQSSSTERRILEACERMIGERGLTGVSVDEIAAEAGVASVTVYRIYGSREGLLRAMLIALSPQSEVSSLLDERPVREVLLDVATHMLRFIRDHRAIVFASLTDARELLQSLRETRRGTRAQLTSFFRRHRAELRGSPEALTRGFVSAVLGRGMMLHEDERLPTVARQLVDLFLQGASK